MVIKLNTLNIGGAIPPKSSFQSRMADCASGPAADEQPPDGGSASGSTSGAAGHSGSDSSASANGGDSGPVGGGSSGPSAQTRNAQAGQAEGAARPRSRATGSTGRQSVPATVDSADDGDINFGSVMATALGRSAAASTDSGPSPSAASGQEDAGAATGSATAGNDSSATLPSDAVAWIAQVMMTPAAPQSLATTATASGSRTTSAGSAPGGVGAVAASGTPGATLATALGAAAADAASVPPVAVKTPGIGRSAANDAGSGNFSGDSPLQSIAQNGDPGTAQASDAQNATTAAANASVATNISALAGVQRLISGMTGTQEDQDSDDTVSATPVAHASPGTDSTDAAQSAAALQAASLTRAGGSLGTATLSIQAPVASAAFADEVSSRVTSLAQSGLTQAQLQLNPADLGPVQVHITLQSGQASVWFGATHPDTRAALEQSLPRLREMFAGAGLPLGDSGVFREPPQQQPPAQSLPGSGIARATGTESTASAGVTQVTQVRLSLLDTYA